ncbi:MAG: Rpn family recombination-promoting nuclease/putative transposase [Spirochaetaceae bacterium]|nr:Rpn family recombination-promoting nuclease/putative transposase [Spirochaetaceae bacterium]
MSTNLKYKSSVFSFIFNNPDILRELYYALEGIELPKDTPITINTLQDVLYMDKINDLSFEIDGKIVVVIEHQSTINPNMALRLLMYIARIYEKTVSDRKIYSSQQVKIPRPEFFVLYNGKEPYPNEKRLKLSDAFEDISSLGTPEKANQSIVSPSLELEVRVININEGQNEEIAKKCRTLYEYGAFIAKVREYERLGMSHEEAVKKAILYCLEHDILKEFLEKNASEVTNMLITEWNWDVAKEVWQEEAREEGREEERNYFLELLHQGLSTDEIEARLSSDKDKK